LALRQIVDQLAAPGVEVWGPDAANPAPGAYFYDFLSNITEMEARSGAPAHIIDQATSVLHFFVSFEGDACMFLLLLLY
jgi:hypothetical protein